MDALKIIMERLDMTDKRLLSLEAKVVGIEVGLGNHVKIVEEFQADVSVMKKTFRISKRSNKMSWLL